VVENCELNKLETPLIGKTCRFFERSLGYFRKKVKSLKYVRLGKESVSLLWNLRKYKVKELTTRVP